MVLSGGPKEGATVKTARSGKRMNHRKRLLMSVLAMVCCSGGSGAYAGWADGVAITNEAAFFAELDLSRASLKPVRAAVEKVDWPAAKAAWATYLQDHVAPRWIWSYRDRDRIKKLLAERYGGLDKYVPAAEDVLKRKFRCVGVSRTLTHDIAWTSPDYEYEWCNVLNRHGYWQTLGRAWWQTGDAKYAKDWVEMLHDWIDDNPVDKGGQPWRTLEVGGRASSWFDLINLFIDATAFDPEAKYAITRSLVEHARVLYADIKRVGFQPGNWQLTKSEGLATVGIMLPEFKEAAAWRELGFRILEEHMRRGVYPDGGHCELTPRYHYHCMNAFLNAAILAKKNGYELPGLAQRHEKMFEFLMHLSKPNRGYAPVGDAGTGSPGIVTDSMQLGALLYGRKDMRYLAGNAPIPESWVWMFPPRRLDEYAALPAEKPSFTSHMMPYSKYAVMRTGWEPKDRWFLFDCAPWGGNHSHGDRLQVGLYSGRDLLIDPGQYSYDQPLAKTYFRSAAAHNVLLLDEKDQPTTNPDVLSWNISDRVEFAAGRIVTGDKSVTHQRSVLFVKPDYWVVVDHVTGKGDPALTRLFHFPVVKVEHDAASIRTCYEQGDNVWVGKADDSRLEMRKGWVPTAATQAVEAPVAAFVSQQSLPAALCTVLVPFGDKTDIPKVERLPSDHPEVVTIRVRFKDGRTDWIAIAPQVTEFKGTHTGKGIALCARTLGDKTTVDVIQPKPLADSLPQRRSRQRHRHD